ncbi:MAG: hypothetical protein DRP09_11035 [Candidatus Thorarchaeota archaeon]|nr:MAG: hypothetical protein DRP09_11035 [Candidatus Thorarchaeota archaeon]
MFHKHKWIEIARTYSPSIFERRLNKVKIDVLTDELSHGVTEILWECAKCQETKKESLLGKELNGR